MLHTYIQEDKLVRVIGLVQRLSNSSRSRISPTTWYDHRRGGFGSDLRACLRRPWHWTACRSLVRRIIDVDLSPLLGMFIPAIILREVSLV